jgi:hypothetical protein
MIASIAPLEPRITTKSNYVKLILPEDINQLTTLILSHQTGFATAK